jgi:hypothetical protein
MVGRVQEVAFLLHAAIPGEPPLCLAVRRTPSLGVHRRSRDCARSCRLRPIGQLLREVRQVAVLLPDALPDPAKVSLIELLPTAACECQTIEVRHLDRLHCLPLPLGQCNLAAEHALGERAKLLRLHVDHGV